MKNKLLFSLGTMSAIALPTATSIACSSPLSNIGPWKNLSDLAFYNYLDYINPGSSKKRIEQKYDYVEFGDLPELRRAIQEERVAAGVGSDYYNVILVEKQLINKIDFSKVLKITKDKTRWRAELKRLFSDQAMKIMDAFKLNRRNRQGDLLDASGNVTTDINQASNDIDGDGQEDYLWEYMLPYFIQSKVVGINPFKIEETTANKAFLDTLKGTARALGGYTIDQNAIQTLFNSDLSYENIFKTLTKNGFKNLTINNYFRDNLMIGSEANGKFTGYTTKDNYSSQVENFERLIKIYNGKKVFVDSGTGSLNTLLKYNGDGYLKNTSDSDTALLYNGDALYARYGGTLSDEDEDEGKKRGDQIRIIKPENPSFLLDGIVFPYYLKPGKELDEIYEKVYNALYQGIDWDINENSYYSQENMVYQNFDFVNYTPVSKKLNQYIINEDQYFDSDDEYGKIILKHTQDSQSLINRFHVTQPISENLESNIFYKYNKLVEKYSA